MSDAIPSRPPLSPAEGWNPPSRDFFGGPPPVDMADPTNVTPVQSEREFLYGDVPPEVVFTAGGAIAAPSQARRYATFKPLLERIGPGAGAMVEREMDRARAFEVIARAAIAWSEEWIDEAGELSEHNRKVMSPSESALYDAVAENRAAI